VASELLHVDRLQEKVLSAVRSSTQFGLKIYDLRLLEQMIIRRHINGESKGYNNLW